MDALARAREIAAKLSGAVGGSDLGKRKNRWDDDQGASGPGLGSIERKKVYIPQNTGDINYLGLLIGPKGVTQKQMQDMSGAKIIIRGRGASKDGGPSNTGHPDDNDELHVSIEGTSDAVARAWKEVEQILYNPEQALKLKSAQLATLGNSDIYGPGGDSGSYSLELKVPNNMVGLIIGKGGENIVRIQSQLGVHAQIAKENEMLPGETTRSIVLKGSPPAVAEAKTRIDDIISAQLMKLSGNSNIKDMHEAYVVKLPVPNDKVGIIIGKGGMTIKAIQDKCRVNVQIPAGPDDDDPLVRTLAIGGDSREAIDAAQMEIFMTLQSQQQLAQQTYNSTANALMVAVPDDKVGIIIGKQGATVKDIQNRLRVKIQIPQQADLGTNPPIRTISIVGPPDMQPQAKYEIDMIVAGTPLNGAPTGNGGGNNNSYYGSSTGSSWGASAAYGMAAAANYYGSAATTAGYGAAGYGAGYDALSYYGMAAGYAGYPADAGLSAAAVAPAVAAETDPTAYYNDYWTYAAYYGEAAARLYYGAWSPPEGTPPPAGVVVAADPAVAATADGSTPAVTESSAPSDGTGAASATSETDAAADPAAAWEAYKKQYAEWYEAYGKAAGADPNPPMTS